jgi:hypothetical protein
MNISEHVQGLSQNDVQDRPGRSARFPWGLRNRGRDLPRPCRVVYQSDITLSGARLADGTAVTGAHRSAH